MNKESMKKATISACLILKNEGKTIRRCLDSMIGLADEYIIGIDRSCDDNTEKEVDGFLADNKGITLTKYLYTWDNDFSKARNEGMQKATSDYILIMDGHEYFPDEWFNITRNQTIKVRNLFPKIKAFLYESPHDQGYIQLYQQPFNGFIPNNFFLQPRFYRNGFKRVYKKLKDGDIDLKDYKEDKTKRIEFGRASHNTIKHAVPESVISFDEIILIHDAPPDNRTARKEQRQDINPNNLKDMLKKNPNDYRAMFYLGNTYMESGKNKDAIKIFNKYLIKLKDKGDHSEKYQVLLHKAICHNHLKEFGNTRDSLLLATGIDPFRRDAYLLLGDLYHDLKHYKKAIMYYANALNIVPQPSRMFQNGGACTFDLHQKLAFVYAEVGVLEKAIVHLQQAYKFYPNEKWEQQLKIWQDGKTNILVIDRGKSFTRDFIKHLQGITKYRVVETDMYDNRLGKWADKIWMEWGNDDAYICSKRHPEKTVIRLHGWEAYGLPQYWKQTDWNKVKKNVFVCEHIRERMIEKGNIKPEKTQVIYNGVDTNKFYIKEETRDPKNIGYAGHINVKKNPMLLFRIIKANPDYNFHLRITHQDPYYKPVMEHELKDCKNVIIHDWYNDLNDFWNQMSGVLSSSIIESFSYNTAEGMASGCKPYIYNWMGARDLWDNKWIFDDMPEFTKDISLDDRKEYRKYILEHYPLKKSLIEMEKVLVE